MHDQPVPNRETVDDPYLVECLVNRDPMPRLQPSRFDWQRILAFVTRIQRCYDDVAEESDDTADVCDLLLEELSSAKNRCAFQEWEAYPNGRWICLE